MGKGAVLSGQTIQKRDHRFDNLRFVLMLLVIFGHTLELFKGEVRQM